MVKERLFRKKITVDNFKLVAEKEMPSAGKSIKGKLFKIDAELVAEVYYTPRGYCCEIEHLSPLDIWCSEQFCRIEAITNESPEGDLVENYFDTQLAAMHFITRRLKRLGWEPLDNWQGA